MENKNNNKNENYINNGVITFKKLSKIQELIKKESSLRELSKREYKLYILYLQSQNNYSN